MSGIVLDFEIADEIFARELRSFVDLNVQGFLFCSPKEYITTKQHFICREVSRSFTMES